MSMTIINTHYSTNLPSTGNLAGNAAKTNAQISSTRGPAERNLLASIDWASMNEIKSHQIITLQKSTNMRSSDGLDSFVNVILSHIASPAR